ncbi:MAG TPA: HRDC domain-containing protein, partial [Chloroflexia bacterium]|nr:HRDC domain-containing protein [Chloroflexia bacterium]
HTAALDPDRCRHFGALAMCAQSAMGDKLLALVKAGYLRQETNEDNRPFLVLTAKGREETPPPDLVQLDYKHGIGPAAEQKRAAREAWRRGTVEAAAHLADDVAGADSADVADRFERLRLWRRTVAQREGVPPFMIFHDRVLDAMARAAVATLDDLRAVRGVGQVALAKYGPDLLAILAVEESPSEAPAVGDQADPGPGPAQ